MKGGEHIPDTESDDKLALSFPATLGAAGDKGVGLTARDDDADFECARNHPLTFFSGPPSLDMVLSIFCLTRQGRGT
jgi:hypothetical protein